MQKAVITEDVGGFHIQYDIDAPYEMPNNKFSTN